MICIAMKFKSKSFENSEKLTSWVNENTSYINEIVGITCCGHFADHVFTVFYWEHEYE